MRQGRLRLLGQNGVVCGKKPVESLSIAFLDNESRDGQNALLLLKRAVSLSHCRLHDGSICRHAREDDWVEPTSTRSELNSLGYLNEWLPLETLLQSCCPRRCSACNTWYTCRAVALPISDRRNAAKAVSGSHYELVCNLACLFVSMPL